MGKDLASKTKVAKATVCFKGMLLLSLLHLCVGVSCLVLDCDPVWYYHLVKEGKANGFADHILAFICLPLSLFW